MTRRRDAVVRRGLRHVVRAIAGQPRMFALAVLGSSLYAAMTVASAYVIGAITQRVVLPAFAEGRTMLEVADDILTRRRRFTVRGGEIEDER